MTDFFESTEWDEYWDSSKEKPKKVQRIVGYFRGYFGNQYIKTLNEITSGSIGKILEVGCGTAHSSRKLTKDASGCYAIDYSEKAKKYWKDNFVHYLVADGFFLPFKSDVFDVVWNAGVLEHFPNPQDILGEMIRVCKPGGVVCVFVPYIFDFTAHFRLYGEERIFTKKSLKHELRELQNVKVKVLYSVGAMVMCGWGEKNRNHLIL